MEYLAEHGSIGIKEIRGLLGVKKSAADALITRLQLQCRVVTGDIIRVYRGPDLHYNGWQVSSFCTPESLFCVDAIPGPPHPGRGPLPRGIAGPAGGAYPGNRPGRHGKADSEDAAITGPINEKTSF